MDSETTTRRSIDDETQFHVLAVDDSIIDRKLIERLLKTSSYRVTAVPSVTKALEFLGLLQDHHDHDEDEDHHHHQQQQKQRREDYSSQVAVNLIISDYSMPDMTGYDLLRRIKDSGSSLKDIPFVIMSSENIPSRINRCLEEGAEEFFLKPVQMSDVNKLKPYLMRDRLAAAAAASASSSLKNNNNGGGGGGGGGGATSPKRKKSMEDGFLPHRSKSRFINNNNNNLEMTC